MKPYFHSPHCVLISFPGGGGGKTVANCLAISDHSTLWHAEGGISTREAKHDYLRRRFQLSVQEKRWADLGQRGSSMIGQPFNDNLLRFVGHDTLASYYSDLDWHPRFCEVTHGDLDFHMPCHSRSDFDMHHANWHRSRTVRCVNADQVINELRPDWRGDAVTAQGLTDMIRHEDQLIQADHSFDLTSMLDETQFAAHMRQLYEALGYNDWEQCEQMCRQYHHMWLQAHRKHTFTGHTGRWYQTHKGDSRMEP